MYLINWAMCFMWLNFWWEAWIMSPKRNPCPIWHPGNTSRLSRAITDVLNRQKVTCSLAGAPNNKKKKK